MEDPDDSNRFGKDAIVDDVLTNATTAKSRRNSVLGGTNLWVHQELVHGLYEAISITIPLL
jgi:hypothetical protein